MIDTDHVLPVTGQCELLGVPRSTFYYQPKPVPVEDLELMRQIDRIHLKRPSATASSRRLGTSSKIRIAICGIPLRIPLWDVRLTVL